MENVVDYVIHQSEYWALFIITAAILVQVWVLRCNAVVTSYILIIILRNWFLLTILAPAIMFVFILRVATPITATLVIVSHCAGSSRLPLHLMIAVALLDLQSLLLTILLWLLLIWIRVLASRARVLLWLRLAVALACTVVGIFSWLVLRLRVISVWGSWVFRRILLLPLVLLVLIRLSQFLLLLLLAH